MTETKLDRGVIFVLRILMGWTFLYAGVWQIWDNFDTAGFLNHVVTFHAAFAVFGTPTMLPITDLLVKWGHLLIGLSLISGFLVRVSGPFGILLMITYYFAHMQFPFIEDHLNYLVDFHLVGAPASPIRGVVQFQKMIDKLVFAEIRVPGKELSNAGLRRKEYGGNTRDGVLRRNRDRRRGNE